LECILNQVDPQFEATQGLNYRLSILLCQDGFSFLITDAISNKVLKLASFQLSNADFQHVETGGWPSTGNQYFELLKKTDFSLHAYQKVDIAIASHKVTVAPPEFIQSGNETDIMSVSQSWAANEQIITEPIFDQGPVTAIVIPGYIKEYCEIISPGSRLHTAPAIFVKGVMREYARILARQVFINIYRGYFEISVIQSSRLLYLNAFKYSAPEDVLYFVIFVLEQLGFVPSEEKVTLMGDIAENSIIANQLKMYCASLSYAVKPHGIEYGEAFTGIAPHNYFTLLTLSVCES
jgi:hypothetical protein